jgi:hypothetical protein
LLRCWNRPKPQASPRPANSCSLQGWSNVNLARHLNKALVAHRTTVLPAMNSGDRCYSGAGVDRNEPDDYQVSQLQRTSKDITFLMLARRYRYFLDPWRSAADPYRNSSVEPHADVDRSPEKRTDAGETPRPLSDRLVQAIDGHDALAGPSASPQSGVEIGNWRFSNRTRRRGAKW